MRTCLGFSLLAQTRCATGHDQAAPDLDIPAAYRASAATQAAAWPAEDWWTGFASPELNDLIEQARKQNFDIQAAIARVRQADAQVRIAGAALLPTLNGTASADWEHFGLNTGSTSVRRGVGSNASADFRSYSIGLSAAYQVDFWGHNLSHRQSLVASAEFSRFDQRTVALTVVTNVANAWFTALALADRLAVARRNVADSEQTLAVIRGRMQAGTASALDVANQATLVAGEQTNIPNFRNQLEQALISLGILVGEPPERITVRPGTLTALKLPLVYAGLPSALLERRPDVASAEAQLVASGFDVTTARTAFYPAVNLTGSAGYQAAALNALISPGGFIASLAAGLTAPIFDAGALRGALEQARGRQAELLADYRKAVVQAFTDVDNALTAWRYGSEQEKLQVVAVDTARQAALIARQQMLAGTADVTAVLTAEAAAFTAEDTLVQVRLARVQALLNLYKALGGGWKRSDAEKFPGLSPGMLEGGVALPVGGNR
ncbi:MAG TPA: efflux transporter outer membrane subunit [Acetobacteraceae bacterium]|nr:efflux transporter outer membrane subunit [Acetobacteraceae bacterium]